MNDEKLKAILQALVAEVADIRASQAVAIVTLQKQLKVAPSTAETAISSTKFSQRSHFDMLLKAIEEL